MTPKYSPITVNGGQYKHPMRIFRIKDDIEQDETGDQTPIVLDRYDELFVIYGLVNPQQGREMWDGGRINMELQALAWTRYSPQFEQPGLVIEWIGKGKFFRVVSAMNINGNDREIEMQLREMPVGQPMRNPQ